MQHMFSGIFFAIKSLDKQVLPEVTFIIILANAP